MLYCCFLCGLFINFMHYCIVLISCTLVYFQNYQRNLLDLVCLYTQRFQLKFGFWIILIFKCMLITFIFIHYCGLHFVFKENMVIFNDHSQHYWTSTVFFWASHFCEFGEE